MVHDSGSMIINRKKDIYYDQCLIEDSDLIRSFDENGETKSISLNEERKKQIPSPRSMIAP